MVSAVTDVTFKNKNSILLTRSSGKRERFKVVFQEDKDGTCTIPLLKTNEFYECVKCTYDDANMPILTRYGFCKGIGITFHYIGCLTSGEKYLVKICGNDICAYFSDSNLKKIQSNAIVYMFTGRDLTTRLISAKCKLTNSIRYFTGKAGSECAFKVMNNSATIHLTKKMGHECTHSIQYPTYTTYFAGTLNEERRIRTEHEDGCIDY